MTHTLKIETHTDGTHYTRNYGDYKAIRISGKGYDSTWSLFDRDDNFKARLLNVDEIEFYISHLRK